MTGGERDLPKGWVWSTVGVVAEVQLGRQRSPQHHFGDQMRPYLRSANIGWSGLKLDDVNEMNFDDKDFETYRLLPGDLLLNEASGSPNEVGKPALWTGEIDGCCFQNTLLRVKPWGVSAHYLYWYCYGVALTGQFGEAGRGVNIRHLGKQGLARFPVPLAPRSEQERIVAAVDEHLSRLDAAESLLSRVASLQVHRARSNPATIDSRIAALRRSILAAAFSGRLTAQDPSDESGDVLLARIADERSSAGTKDTSRAKSSTKVKESSS